MIFTDKKSMKDENANIYFILPEGIATVEMTSQKGLQFVL